MSSASDNMDKELLLIQHLYGEREDAEELNELLKDPACRAEYEALRDVKRKTGKSSVAQTGYCS